jgi:hypothetical protein
MSKRDNFLKSYGSRHRLYSLEINMQDRNESDIHFLWIHDALPQP